jgi:DNA-binding NarL/FixJ family response regulator
MAPEMNRYRIVLADDHLLFRQGLRKLIEGVAGLEVVGEAGDGLELLASLNILVPHMIMLDVSMPNLRGVDAIPEIKLKHPDVKVLILSMHKEYLHQALSAGADGYLLKEDADQDLFSAIECIRQGSTYLSPRLTEHLVSGTAAPCEVLTGREKEVLKLIAQGKSSKEVGDILFISPRTVERHRANIMEKLDLKNTADLIRYAVQKGYV